MLVVAEISSHCDNAHGWPDWQSRALSLRIVCCSLSMRVTPGRQLQLRSESSQSWGQHVCIIGK